MDGKWIDRFHGIIPPQQYSVALSNGEHGLIITLTGQEYTITIDFGNTDALQMLDEGTLLQGTDTLQLQQLRTAGFPDTIYEIEDGALGRYILSCMGPELFQHKQYNIITLNYVISVVTQWEPEITVIKV